MDLKSMWESVENIPPSDSNIESKDGLTVGPYTVGDKLGDGEFASVHSCWKGDKKTPSYAIKKIGKAKLVRSGDAKRSIRRIRRIGTEIEAMLLLKHPNICQLYNVYHSNDYVMLVLEVGGRDLYDFSSRYPKGQGESTVQHIVLRLALALDHCTSLGVMHRDLKPENVLVRYETASSSPFSSSKSIQILDVKLCDFGLCALAAPTRPGGPPGPAERTAAAGAGASKASGGDEKEAASSGGEGAKEVEADDTWTLSDFAGSPGFFAPELLLASKYDGRLIDVWSLGCVMIELLFGHDVFNDVWMVPYAPDCLSSVTTFASELGVSLRAMRDKVVWPSPESRSFGLNLLAPQPKRRPLADGVVKLPWLAKELASVDDDRPPRTPVAEAK